MAVAGEPAMLTLPNILTLSRILAVPILVALLWPAEQGHEWRTGYALAFGLYCLMGITDYFDGYLARAKGTVSKLGIFLDPIADKIMVGAVILMLSATHDIHGPHIIAAMVILLREIAVSGLREFLAGLRVSVPVSQLAKWKTTCQLVALGAVFAGFAFHHAFIEDEAFWSGSIFYNEHLIHAMHEVPTLVKLSATIVMLLGFTIAWYGYIRNTQFPAMVVEQLGQVYRFVYRKWMFDELYHYLFVVPAFWLGKVLWKRGDEGTIDRFGPNGAAWLVAGGASYARKIQSGYLNSYALVMLLGLVGAITWVLF